MSIKKYTKTSWTYDGSYHSKKIVGSCMGTEQLIYSDPNVSYGTGNVTVGGGPYYIVPSELEYYFNEDNAVLFSDKLKGSFGSLSALADEAISLMTTAIIQNKKDFLFNNTNEYGASLSDKKQGIYFTGNNADAACFAQIELYISRNVYNASDMSRDVTIGGYIGYNSGTWRSDLGYWKTGNNYTIRVAKFSYSGKDVTGGVELIRNLFAVAKSIRMSPGPKNRWDKQSGWTYKISGYKPEENVMAIDVKGAAPLIESGVSHVIAFAQAVPFAGSWSAGGGDIDPTDPWDTPEPYPDTPPKPPTPDPPVPVDPVDPVPEPDDPPIGAADIGFMSIYSPDRSTLKHIAEQFWNPTALEAIKQYFTDPMDAIIGLSIVPVLPETRAAEAVVIGMYNTHVGAPVVTTEYATHNCGSVYIPKFFNSYLDYDPYTKYQLYLPYIGEVELNADEITSKTITIKYKCNVVTGDCVALVMIGNNVFGTFNGNFSRQVPVTAANYGAIISAAVNVATTAAQVGVGVIGSQLTGEAIAENAVKASSQELTPSGNIRAAGAKVAAMNTAASGAASLVNNVMSAKATYTKSGNVGQGAGQIAVRTPFITITRPNLTLPENIDQASKSSLRRYVGYASNKIGRLSSFHGLTVVEACKLSSQHATDGEIAEALEIMRGGVIL